LQKLEPHSTQMPNKDFIYQCFSILFGVLVSFIGFVNTFWGNDPYYGLIILLLSLLFYLPLVDLIRTTMQKKYSFPLKFLIGFLILWTSLGVGELFDKVKLMIETFPYTNITGI
tara:strand:+ start:215 stop:556 length:342 start_codon:yes stop_codon:yes gene_type:complete